MKRLLFQIVAGILGVWLSVKVIPGVDFTGEIKYLFYTGTILGLANSLIRPPLKLITLPLRMLTFGLFTLVINMAIVWLVSLIFPEWVIPGLTALFWTSVLVWGISWLLPKLLKL